MYKYYISPTKMLSMLRNLPSSSHYFEPPRTITWFTPAANKGVFVQTGAVDSINFL